LTLVVNVIPIYVAVTPLIFLPVTVAVIVGVLNTMSGVCGPPVAPAVVTIAGVITTARVVEIT